MVRATLPFVLMFLLQPPASFCADRPAKQAPAGKEKPGGKAASMTGCVDETGASRYVLLDQTGLRRLAELEAVGFPNEGFAKHLGHKITATGTVIDDNGRIVLKVRKIETVSETCDPARPSQ